jgi:hypothetical protein
MKKESEENKNEGDRENEKEAKRRNKEATLWGMWKEELNIWIYL